jgi:hypothetical protein
VFVVRTFRFAFLAGLKTRTTFCGLSTSVALRPSTGSGTAFNELRERSAGGQINGTVCNRSLLRVCLCEAHLVYRGNLMSQAENERSEV